MSIVFQETHQCFHLQTQNTSYIIHLPRYHVPLHLYWGRKIRNADVSHLLLYRERAFSAEADLDGERLSLDTLPQEYPAHGNTDLRVPAYQVQLENGTTITDLRVQNYRILCGKPLLQGLPATYTEADGEADTLELELADSLIGLKVILSYTVFNHSDVITRSVRFINEGEQKLKLLSALSMSVDFNRSAFDFMHLSSARLRERHIERHSLRIGNQSIESRRGASSHQHNPFIALLGKNTDEDQGEVYGFSLVYSGNFIAQAEVDQYQTTRVSLGINPFDFTWLLEPGEIFQTPEVVMVYSSNGLGEMSRIYHRLYRSRLCKGFYRDKPKPVLVNNWEATSFHFSVEILERIAKTGKELGIELFVLDDGWFGKRNNDKCSLGDWYVNREKLPNGLKDLADRINTLGMQFGLWFEPEMVSPDSDLYRQHPDWCIHVPDRGRSLGRNQLVLDFSREEVCDAIVKMVSDILSSAPITYVKWDMNRNMTEVGSAAWPPERQREVAHRYMLGVYRVMDKITSAFPHILFEGCSGGGGRFDPGMLYYMPQIWTSDNSDAVERLKIQYGTSVVYPVSTMGAHVSAIPNQQVGRITSLEIRGNAAMSGNLGYELDLSKFSEEERELAKKQVAFYKEIRHLVQFGDFYRLLSPFKGNEAAWMFVDEYKTEAFICYFKVLAQPNEPFPRIYPKCLDPDKNYKLLDTGEIYGGDELMYAGLSVPTIKGDFQSFVWRFKAVL